MITRLPKTWLGALTGLLLLASAAPAAQGGGIAFEDRTVDLGVPPFNGPSFGAGAWGDWDGDGRPDLWLGNHANHPQLYHNRGDGTFEEIAPFFWSGLDRADTHGAAWADYDFDGDLDLVELVGAQSGVGSGPNHLFRNDSGFLTEIAFQAGLDYPLGRGRTPLWLDWNLDGDLDLLATGLDRPGAATALFTQAGGVFSKADAGTGFVVTSTDFQSANFTDLNEDGHPDLLLLSNDFPTHAFDLTQNPMVDIAATSGYPNVVTVEDTVFADFNGDGVIDNYLSRYSSRSENEVAPLDDWTLRGRLIVKTSESSFTFTGGGSVLFVQNFPANLVFLGSGGVNPADTTFSVNASNSAHQGIMPHNPGVDDGVYIGWNTTTSEWEVYVSASVRSEFAAVMTGTNPVALQQTNGFFNWEGAPDKMILHNLGGIYTEWSVPFTWSTRSIAVGDFDNDMDQDLYLVASGAALNRPNILLENQGDGTMVPVALAGGAEGPITGIGDGVSVVDYDGDGYLDLFVTNAFGHSILGTGPGPNLYRNLGGANHWLELDLEGIESARDAVGARVTLTVNGHVQVRDQALGIHRFTQNHSRLHFGLGTHTSVDQIEIEWPSGIVQVLNNVPADQILTVYEETTPTPKEPPTFLPGVDRGVYLWKDTFDGPYRLRVSSDSQASSYDIHLVTERRFGSITGVDLDANDTLVQNFGGFEWTGTEQSGAEGVDFTLPPNVRAMLSVEIDGKAIARQIMIGASGTHPVPVGWILRSDELSPFPSQLPEHGVGLGVFSPNGGSTVQARWDGIAPGPLGNFSEVAVLSSQPMSNSFPVGLEAGEGIGRNVNAVAGFTRVKSNWDWDGFNLDMAVPGDIGVYWKQDGQFQPHRVYDPAVFRPNAYIMPLATPYAFPAPEFDPAVDANLFLWRNINGKLWQVQTMSGSQGPLRFAGTVTSDRAVQTLVPRGLEAGDVLDNSNPMVIVFDFTVDGDTDGFDFNFPAGATLDFDLTSPSPNPEQWVRIGQDQWTIASIPVDIGGWAF